MANTGDIQKAQLCCELQPNLRLVADNSGALPLHWIARQEPSSALLECMVGMDDNRLAILNAADQSGWTALHFAVFNLRVRVVRWLLENGCDVNVCDKQGRTAFDLAEQRENPAVLELIQRAGGHSGQTA